MSLSEPSSLAVIHPDSVVGLAASVPSARWKQIVSTQSLARAMTARSAAACSPAFPPGTRFPTATEVGVCLYSKGDMYGVWRNSVAVSGLTTGSLNGVGTNAGIVLCYFYTVGLRVGFALAASASISSLNGLGPRSQSGSEV